MGYLREKFVLFIVILLLCVVQGQARTGKYELPFNLDWKFIQGNPANAQTPTFGDAAWQTVSVPHSASYDQPTVAGELGFYGSPGAPNKDYWYRKKFVCPSDARKVFIYFGAIMQSVTVFVNGTQVGTHYNSGYTGFFFDISSNVVKGDSTCIAIHANINNDQNIPPGGSGWTSNGGAAPDYLLYSGMYRDVRLVFKDSVYVPLRGQLTNTAGTAANPTLHAVTSVRNEAAAAKSVTVALNLRTAAGASVATQTATLSVPANSTSNFDMTTGAIAAPSLWSPATPTLYSLQTLVSVNGSVVDSLVEPVGLRFYSWSAGTPGGLSVNGALTELKGVCMGQWMGWIENAVPDSRFGKIVGMIKAMGVNSIRCSHYPRADAFYHACDSVGMLVLCETPNWGTSGGFAGLTTFWTRMYACDSAMVLDGYNHPCIYAWSLFNEPSEKTLATQFANESNIIHTIEAAAPAGRVTLIANLGGNYMYPLDIYGLNYGTTTTTTIPIVNTEDYQNWFRVFVRGNAMDLNVANGSEANLEVTHMTGDWSTTDKCGGAHFWCFMDYCSYRNQTGREGLVDRLYIPKNVYFMFRNTLTGAATDYWTNGTPAQVALAADLIALRADGADISQIVATLRDATGACVQPAAGCNITFTVTAGAASVAMLYTGNSAAPTSGAATVTCAVEGGRAGILLRTSRTAGAITVTAASSCALANATVNLVSTPVTEPIPNPLYTPSAALPRSQSQGSVDMLRLKTVYTGKGVMISFPSGAEKSVQVIDCRGKVMASYALKNGVPALVGHNVAGSGIFYAVWNDNGRQMLSRLNLVH